MKKKIAVDVNGKFLGQRVTGVQRYSREIVLAIDSLLALPKYSTRLQVRILVPGDASQPLPLQRIELYKTRGRGGHVWEQLQVPFYSFGRSLLNLSGSAPWLKMKQYVTIHDAVLFEHPSAYSRAFRWWYRSLFRWLGFVAIRIFTVSRFSKHRLEIYLPQARGRFEIAYNGKEHFDSVIPDVSVLSEHSLEPGDYFLVVGSRNANKNIARLSRVIGANFGHIAEKFVVVGEANSAVFVDDGAAVLPHNMTAVGYVDDNKLKALYANARALIFPSLYEGFGIPLLEAMSVGCPILASTAASIPEVCGSAAIYFDPTDENSITNCIRQFLLHRERPTLPTQPTTDHLSQFSWKVSAAVILDAILEAEDNS